MRIVDFVVFCFVLGHACLLCHYCLSVHFAGNLRLLLFNISGEALARSASRGLCGGQCVQRRGVTRHARYGAAVSTQTVRAVLGQTYHNVKLFNSEMHIREHAYYCVVFARVTTPWLASSYCSNSQVGLLVLIVENKKKKLSAPGCSGGGRSYFCVLCCIS